MPTMKDVAKLAQVSLGTVSNVLNNKASVLPENRQRVLAAVEALGFQANRVARMLKTKVSNDIGLIIPDISNPFYPELVRGVEDIANRLQFTVFLCNSDRQTAKEHRYLDSLLSRNIDGLLIVKPQIALEELQNISHYVDVVLVDTDILPFPGCSVINIDDHGGMKQGLALLFAEGHTQIAFVGGRKESRSSLIRYSEYELFLKAKGLPFFEEYVFHGDYSLSSGYEAAQVFATLENPPTAIFAANDLMAIGCMKALQELGLRVPDDISVIGYDNISMSSLCTPPLTTIRQPNHETGLLGAEVLMRMIAKRQLLNRVPDVPDDAYVLMPTQLVSRESVGPVKK